MVAAPTVVMRSVVGAAPSRRQSPALSNGRAGSVRCYSAAAGLAKPEVEGRIIDLLKNFDKVRCILGCEIWVGMESRLSRANANLLQVKDASKV